MSSGNSCLRLGAILRVLRGLGTSTTWKLTAPALIPMLLGRVGAIQADRLPHNSPPPPTLFPLDPITVSLGDPCR